MILSAEKKIPGYYPSVNSKLSKGSSVYNLDAENGINRKVSGQYSKIENVSAARANTINLSSLQNQKSKQDEVVDQINYSRRKEGKYRKCSSQTNLGEVAYVSNGSDDVIWANPISEVLEKLERIGITISNIDKLSSTATSHSEIIDLVLRENRRLTSENLRITNEIASLQKEIKMKENKIKLFDHKIMQASRMLVDLTEHNHTELVQKKLRLLSMTLSALPSEDISMVAGSNRQIQDSLDVSSPLDSSQPSTLLAKNSTTTMNKGNSLHGSNPESGGINHSKTRVFHLTRSIKKQCQRMLNKLNLVEEEDRLAMLQARAEQKAISESMQENTKAPSVMSEMKEGSIPLVEFPKQILPSVQQNPNLFRRRATVVVSNSDSAQQSLISQSLSKQNELDTKSEQKEPANNDSPVNAEDSKAIHFRRLQTESVLQTGSMTATASPARFRQSDHTQPRSKEHSRSRSPISSNAGMFTERKTSQSSNGRISVNLVFKGSLQKSANLIFMMKGAEMLKRSKAENNFKEAESHHENTPTKVFKKGEVPPPLQMIPSSISEENERSPELKLNKKEGDLHSSDKKSDSIGMAPTFKLPIPTQPDSPLPDPDVKQSK